MRSRNLLDALEPGLILGGGPQAEHAGTRFQLEHSGREPHPGRGTRLLHFDLVPEVLGHPERERFRLGRSDDGV